ncbi:A/G-specific adenine glycosylase [Paenibacillus sp. GCM10012307]|uniref:Adenine DNA glycosylase n=1 Tax=Paenibacillus roseus TaxID=2798579 RepID=A0A934J8V6_9BACL|nr:A/G-specific adenine glycosylase [Paenibacillus roseus]MBJ6362811.1 A/G-specific adenine glycosylase [Paenibacillus roseus]
MADIKLYFSEELLSWFHIHKRTLPWRQNRDPYRVWVSEIMLQQTRVDTVIPYYERFMDRFPTVTALAEAPEAEVLKCWEGLGYYSRARNLQAGAREVVDNYNSVIPDDADAVAGLKGIGPYTRGAVMSIAFNRPEPAVDGNVMRVLSRYFCLEDDIAKPRTRIQLEHLAKSLIPEGAAGDFNQALMELGALVCTPKSPGCLTCPVMVHCQGRLVGKENVLPIKTKAKPPREERRLVALIEGSGSNVGKVLVRQRPETGLLAQMWELPHLLEEEVVQEGKAIKTGRGRKKKDTIIEESSAVMGLSASPDSGQMEQLGRGLAAETGLLIRPRHRWMEAEHIFSHIIWKLDVFLADFGFVLKEKEIQQMQYETLLQGGLVAAEQKAEYNNFETAPDQLFSGYAASETAASVSGPEQQEVPLPAGYRWIGPEDMRELAFPNVFLRILGNYWSERY